jgi:signal peptidase II
VAGVVVVLDRLTKWLMLDWLRPGESVEITGFFNLVLVYNRGAAFSFLAGAPGWQTPFFVAVALIASGVVSWLLLRHPRQRLLCAGLALILGGALGNLWDRLAWGAVADFLDFHAFGWHWPAFNVADSAITVGAALVIVEGFLRKD